MLLIVAYSLAEISNGFPCTGCQFVKSLLMLDEWHLIILDTFFLPICLVKKKGYQTVTTNASPNKIILEMRELRKKRKIRPRKK